MKTRRTHRWINAVAVLFLFCVMSCMTAWGAVPQASYNLRIKEIKTSAVVKTASGYSRLFYQDGSILIEDYDTAYTIKRRRTLKCELDIYGGFYAGADAYYFVFGQMNTAEDDNAEVIRVVKYSKSWQRLGAASIHGTEEFGGQVRTPFKRGNVGMAEVDGHLYIVTGHEGYVDPDYNMGHQGMLMIEVNEATMSGRITDADYYHSLSQHITIKDADHIYVLEESESGRRTKITKKSVTDQIGETITALKYGGERTSAWAIATGATADAIETSSTHVLALGTSIDRSRYGEDSNGYNIYLTTTPLDDFTEEATTFTWLTSDDLEDGYKDVKMTKIDDNRFMISWEKSGETGKAGATDYDSMSQHVIHYLYIDGTGKVISKERTFAGAMSDCEPIVDNGKVLFYASDGSATAFYTFDNSSGDATKKIYYSAGPDATWTFSNGTLTIRGTGKINDHFSEDSLEQISHRITMVSIGKGITSIGDSAFTYMPNLKYVRIPSGVTKLGKQAFYQLTNLTTVYMPRSVTSIGQETFDATCVYIDGIPMRKGKIICGHGTVAEKYAKSIYMACQAPSVTLANKTVKETGNPIAIAPAKVAFTKGKLSYAYYTDSACKIPTTTANGSLEKGSAPSKTGTYYVRATAAAELTFGVVRSKAAVLTIQEDPTLHAAEMLIKGKILSDTKTGGRYKVWSVTSTGGKPTGGTVSYYAPISKTKTSAVIPTTVTLYGVKMRVTSITAYAFSKCTLLQKVTIGSNVQQIGKYAFSGCKSLKTINFTTSKLTLAKLGEHCFAGIPSNFQLTAPTAVQSKYLVWIKKRM